MTACARKRIFYKKSAARKETRRVMLTYGKKLFIYECEHCGFYHLSKRDHKLRLFEIPSLNMKFWA